MFFMLSLTCFMDSEYYAHDVMNPWYDDDMYDDPDGGRKSYDGGCLAQ